MDKTQLLFIRACKSNNSSKRIEQVYKSFYYCREKPDVKHLIKILVGIIECSSNPLRTIDLIDDLSPMNAWKFQTKYASGSNDAYWQSVKSILVSHIRLTAVHDFPYYPLPAKFKNQQKGE